MDRRLYKSSTDRVLTGVCGGIADFFNIDPTIVRVIFFLLSFAQIGTALYFLLAILLPYDYQVEAAKHHPFNQRNQANKQQRRDVTPDDEQSKWDDF